MSEPEQPGVPPRIELDPHPEPPKPAFNPYQAPMAERLEPVAPGWEGDGNPPVPWEDEAAYPGVFERWWATIRLAYTDPMELSERVPSTQPILPSWLFYLVTGVPYVVLSLMLSQMTRQLMSSFIHRPIQQNPVGEIVGAVFGLLLGPIIGGAFLHFFLWMWGGTKEGLGIHQTIRYAGYAKGAYHLIGWIPGLNLIFGLFYWVFLSMGLARVHRTDTWRGFAATLTPVVIAICCIGALVVALIPSMMGH